MQSLSRATLAAERTLFTEVATFPTASRRGLQAKPLMRVGYKEALH